MSPVMLGFQHLSEYMQLDIKKNMNLETLRLILMSKLGK